AKPGRPARTGGHAGKVAAALGALLLLAALAWAMTRGGGEPAGPEAPVAAAEEPAEGTDAGTAELAPEFEALERDAAREEPGEGGGGAGAGAAAEGGEAGARAAAEVQQAIVELNDSWVNGDLDAHLAHYADRVDFYSADDAPRGRIREERERDLRTFNRDRQIRIVRQAVTFPEPDRAVALVDKEWEFRGDQLKREGAGRQEMILERRGDRWVVVSEKMQETYRSEQERV
ncbi:MAG TPA: DUF4440 domain-containing protein, partial [Longimicrobiaceae bacterium]|nr:DUF4440 domain-containing protein [Longimicrobiaceae bacterium]